MSNKFLSKTLFNDILDEKWPIMLILGILYLTIAGYESRKGLLWSIMLETFSDKF